MDKYTTVFIADSAEEFCTELTAALQQSDGFQVIGCASDGEQALRRIAECKPQILVLDLMLAKKDGISILKSLIPWIVARSLWRHPASSQNMWQVPLPIWASAI